MFRDGLMSCMYILSLSYHLFVVLLLMEFYQNNEHNASEY